MNTPEKLATQGIQYDEKHNTICDGHHNAQSSLYAYVITDRHRTIADTARDHFISLCTGHHTFNDKTLSLATRIQFVYLR